MKLQKDLREFIELLISNSVDFVVVGAHAVAFHGYPRFTGDIDILVRSTPANAAALLRALHAFGFAGAGLSETDFLTEGRVVQLGRPPNRIDLLTAITGVSFQTVWDSRIAGELDGLAVAFISRACLIQNKRMTGRTKDLADAEALELGASD